MNSCPDIVVSPINRRTTLTVKKSEQYRINIAFFLLDLAPSVSSHAALIVALVPVITKRIRLKVARWTFSHDPSRSNQKVTSSPLLVVWSGLVDRRLSLALSESLRRTEEPRAARSPSHSMEGFAIWRPADQPLTTKHTLYQLFCQSPAWKAMSTSHWRRKRCRSSNLSTHQRDSFITAFPTLPRLFHNCSQDCRSKYEADNVLY